MKKVIITGAAGFIGSNLTNRMIKEGYKVYAFVYQDNDYLIENPNLNVMKLDFTEYKNLDKYIDETDFEAFYYLAWAGYGKATNDYNAQVENIKPLCDAIVASKSLNCKKFIFSSSFSEYMVENNNLDNKIPNVYGAVKHAARITANSVANKEGVWFTSVGFANTFGPGDYSKRATNMFINQLLDGKDLNLTSGVYLYDWNYIEDTINGLLSVQEKGKENKFYYLGSNDIRPLKEIVYDVRDIINKNAKVNLGVYKDNFHLDYSQIDLYELYNDTGYQSITPFDYAVKQTVKWIKRIREVK